METMDVGNKCPTITPTKTPEENINALQAEGRGDGAIRTAIV